MKHSRFKYYSEAIYAEKFMDGELRCWNAAYFRDYEDAQAEQIIGDQYEGVRFYRPVNGLAINNETQKRSFTLDMGLECLTRAHEIYIFCMSDSFTDKVRGEFQAKACVEVLNPRAFINRWLDAIPEEARKQGNNVARKVRYYLPENLPENVWALPDLIITTKLQRFAYQDEYRMAYTTTDCISELRLPAH